MRIPLALCAALALGAHAQPDTGLRMLATWMSGSYSSAAQAAADSSYFDIRLHMAPIWPERADGPWLYVEQAVAGQPPYRQRVYHLTTLGGGRYCSEVWELPQPLDRYDGAWHTPAKLGGLTPDSLFVRAGCQVELAWDGKEQVFRGGTPGEGCKSSLKGASFATSDVLVSQDSLVSWDRGWDAHGHQVWGATLGGYRFIKE